MMMRMDAPSGIHQGLITSFNCMTGKYAVFFHSDKTSEEFALDEDRFMILD